MIDIIATVFSILAAFGFGFALIGSDEKWAPWVGSISAAILITGIFFGGYKDEQKPKEIRTKQPPQIDTIIEIRNSIPDTSYVYRFYKEDKR